MQGWLVIIWPEESLLSTLWNWLYNNLKESFFVFAAILFSWVAALRRLQQALGNNPSVSGVSYREHIVDVHSGLFFGVGVIFTAIGMRSALIVALGGLDAETAAEQGAFVMLQKLVDGGILLALSTTIVGGIGGYLMRVAKTFIVGERLHDFYIESQETDKAHLQERLESIERLLQRAVEGDR